MKINSVEGVAIYLKEVSAEVTTHDMANHSIFPLQALPNSLCPPFSYLKTELKNKKSNNYIPVDTTEAQAVD
jgi:hypothetical protein